MSHCIEVGAIDADLKRTVRWSWRGLTQHSSLLKADGKPEMPSGRSLFALQSIMLKKVENMMGARMRCCLKFNVGDGEAA